MEEANETLWRSADSSLDMIDALSAEVSFKSLAGTSNGASEFTSPAVSPQKSDVSLGEGLIDALRNLQIASVRKMTKFRPPMISIIEPQESQAEQNPQIDNFVSPQPVDNSEEIGQLVEHLLQQVQPTDLQSIDPLPESINVPIAERNPSVIDDKIEEKDPGTEKTAESTRTERVIPISIAPEILDNMKKAVKPLLKPSTTVRKVTKCVSPMLQTRARCRVTKTSSLTQLNQSTTNNQIKKKLTVVEANRSLSLKRQPTKNIVATVVATKEGIKLKEEKISNFGIPVNIERKKKRTQAVPFSFATRGKNSVQEKPEQKNNSKLPMRDSNSVNQQKQPVIMKSAIKENTLKSQPLKFKLTTKSSLRSESMNKENRSTNLSGQPKTVIGGPKLSTGVKQRENEIGTMRGRIELKKPQKEGVPDLTALKKKNDSKAIPKPAVRIPAPVQSSRKLAPIPLGK